MSAKKLFSIILVLAISMLSLYKVIYFQNITITNNEKTSYSTKVIYDDTVREGTRFIKKVLMVLRLSLIRLPRIFSAKKLSAQR